MNKILFYASERPSLSKEFIAALPLAGLDGTLKSRMKGTIVRAKTGLLSQAAGLAGYAYKQDGTRFVFSFIYNGIKTYEAKELFDQLVVNLVSK